MVERELLLLGVEPGHQVHQLVLQDLDIVVGFASGGGGGAGQREDHSWESGEGAANDHQQEIHGVSEGHVRSGGGASGNSGMLLRCWLICNSFVDELAVVVVVLGEKVVQSLAHEFFDSTWLVGHWCSREPRLGSF
jgi:hypothetical protein